MRKILLTIVVFIFFGCGTMTFSSASSVKTVDNYAHSVKTEISGQAFNFIKSQGFSAEQYFAQELDLNAFKSQGYKIEILEFPNSMSLRFYSGLGTKLPANGTLITTQSWKEEGYTYVKTNLNYLSTFKEVQNIDNMTSINPDLLLFNWDLEFPGSVVDTNADYINNNIATWKRNMRTVDDFTLTSRYKIPSQSCNSNIDVARNVVSSSIEKAFEATESISMPPTPVPEPTPEPTPVPEPTQEPTPVPEPTPAPTPAPTPETVTSFRDFVINYLENIYNGCAGLNRFYNDEYLKPNVNYRGSLYRNKSYYDLEEIVLSDGKYPWLCDNFFPSLNLEFIEEKKLNELKDYYNDFLNE